MISKIQIGGAVDVHIQTRRRRLDLCPPAIAFAAFQLDGIAHQPSQAPTSTTTTTMDVVPSKPLDLGTGPSIIDEDGIPIIQAEASSQSSSSKLPLDTGLVYSTVMMLHSYPTTSVKPSDDHPEAPERISRAFIVLKENGCVQRMKRIQPRQITRDEVALIHQQGVWEGVYRSQCELAI